MTTQLYRRSLPHIIPDHRPIFITFSTHNRLTLEPAARTIALDCCKHEHETRAFVHAAVVMPDHVHLVLSRMLNREATRVHELSEIMHGIKGASAHAVNKLMNRRGRVWQDESFDHSLRTGEALREKLLYVVNNPVRARLAKAPSEYRWTWVADPELWQAVR